MRIFSKKFITRHIVIIIELLFIIVASFLLKGKGGDKSVQQSSKVVKQCGCSSESDYFDKIMGLTIVLSFGIIIYYCVRIDYRNEVNAEKIEDMGKELADLQKKVSMRQGRQ